jgi:hypothetical protein
MCPHGQILWWIALRSKLQSNKSSSTFLESVLMDRGFPLSAVSSVFQVLHTVEVVGSNPAAPTISLSK